MLPLRLAGTHDARLPRITYSQTHAVGKRDESTFAGSAKGGRSAAIECPTIELQVELNLGVRGEGGSSEPLIRVSAGADTWAGRNLLDLRLFKQLGGKVEHLRPSTTSLTAVGGKEIDSLGTCQIKVRKDNNEVEMEAVVLHDLGIGHIPLLIGDPGLRALTGKKGLLAVQYDGNGAQAFVGATKREDETIIETKDSIITRRKNIEGTGYTWWYAWKWKKEAPGVNLTGPRLYKKKGIASEHIDAALRNWIDNGVLEPCENPHFLVPFNPVAQNKKDHPIRMTGDFGKFNETIVAESRETSNEVCSTAIRLVRAHTKGRFMDLSKAYLSVYLEKHLRRFNAFQVGAEWFQASRMLFGVAIGQTVLFLILQKILKQMSITFRDDLFVPERKDEEKVDQLLLENGFNVKPGSTWRLEELTEGGPAQKVLGLLVSLEHGLLWWQRKPLPDNEILTSRDLASVLGDAGSSHLPCLGELRPQVAVLRSLLGRHVGGDQSKWDQACPDHLRDLWSKTKAVTKERKFPWLIPTGIVRLYTDASSIMLGGIIRIVTEQGETGDLLDWSSLNKQKLHINIAELDAAILGIATDLHSVAK